MNTIDIGKQGFIGTSIIHGCMRLAGRSVKEADELINTALELGINYFDHADIYANGESEILFGKVLAQNPGMRNNITLQTKCGIVRSGDGKEIVAFDFTKEHIIEALEGSLKRLGTDHIDTLLLHRPDTLMEPEEVAEAFEVLNKDGKIKNLGVSNQNPMQIELLNKYLPQKIKVNQLQFGLGHTGMVDIGINVNMKNDEGINRDSDILHYCRLNDITIQPWSPFQHGFFGGSIIDNPQFPELNAKLKEIADKYGVTPTGMAITWILRHPSIMQPIIGTVNSDRIKMVCDASDIDITRDEWYALYMAAGKKLP